MHNDIKAVIFDLGNVLVDFDHMIAARRISAFTDKTPEQIYKLFFDSASTGLFEEGKITPAEFFSEVKAMLNLKLDFDKFLPIWNEIFFLSPRNKQVYALAKNLKNRYKTALLSNVNVLHFDYLKKEFPVFDAFDNIITSYDAGFRKPHPEIYQRALAALKVPASGVVYIDDRPELIEKAQGLGIKSFCFRDVEKLSQDLSSVGVHF